MKIIFRLLSIILYLCLGVRTNYPIQRGYIDLPASNNLKVNENKVNTMQKEVWKDIPGYEGFYKASSFGRVKSLNRIIIRSNGVQASVKGKILKIYINDGRCMINIGRGNLFIVSQLIAMAFLGHVPCGFDVVVDHEDNNPLNNYISNLQLITNRENCSKDKVGYTSKYVGVSWFKRDEKWISHIKINGKSTHLGVFENEIDAHNAYQNKLREIIK